MFTTLGTASGVEPAETASVEEGGAAVEDVRGRTAGPWPMLWVAAKGLSRAKELVAGVVSGAAVLEDGSRFSLGSNSEAMPST